MPGPCNSKKKKKLQAKKEKRTQSKQQPALLPSTVDAPSPCLLSAQLPSPSLSVASAQVSAANDDTLTEPPDILPVYIKDTPSVDDNHTDSLSRMQQYLASIKDTEDIPLSLRNPCVEDFGDGPRVRDVQAFLNSKIAAPVSFEDPLCAEFGQREVLEMLCCVLPEETAMIAWYNLSRIKSRVCPACKRLYHPGDPVLEEFQGEDSPTNVEKQKQAREDSWKLHNEQLISGICSALCYFLVAHNYPSAIRSTFGRRAEDISDEAWNELNGPGAGAEDKMGLGMLLKMTRCHDMGLEQLILPGLRAADEKSLESDGYYDDDDEGSDVELEEELENSEIEEITDLDAEPIYTP